MKVKKGLKGTLWRSGDKKRKSTRKKSEKNLERRKDR